MKKKRFLVVMEFFDYEDMDARSVKETLTELLEGELETVKGKIVSVELAKPRKCKPHTP